MGPEIERKVADGDIILAFQHWSNHYQWWIPNTCPHDLKIGGEFKFPATHASMWFQKTNLRNLDFHLSTIDEYLDAQPTRHELLQNYANIQFELLCVLQNFKHIPNWKYLYPVFIHAPDYFTNHETIGFRFVDPVVLDDVRQGRAKIVLTMPFEGFINLHKNRDIEILDKWCKECGLNAEQVYYIHGYFNTSKLPLDLNFTYIPVNAFHCWIGMPRATMEKFEPVDDKNLFVAYSRRGHDHRLIFTCELIKHGLLDRGLVSYHGGAVLDSPARIERLGRPDLIPYAEMLDKMRPLELDLPLDTNNPVGPEHSHYRLTFISTVLETHANTTTIFFSEKIWKPISLGQPFMLIAGMNYLAQLKKLGYKTFDRWIDESYDQMPDLNDRINCVVAQLKKLSLLSITELETMRLEMREVLFHNQKRFVVQWHEEYNANPNHFLYKELLNIWNTF